MYDQRGEPMKTPTTPSTPHFPLFDSSPTHPQHTDGRRESVASIRATQWLRRSSDPSSSSSCVAGSASKSSTSPGTGQATTPIALHIPIIRPLPLRPAIGRRTSSNNSVKHQNRVTKPSVPQHNLHHHQQQQRQQDHRQYGRSHSPSNSPLPSTRGVISPTQEQRQAAASQPSPPLTPLTPRIITISPDSHHLRRSLSSTQLSYRQAVAHLSTKLVPLISVTTGEAHPLFPRSILQYNLLTHDQLDDLARYYHQVVPAVRETRQYPIQIPAWMRSIETSGGFNETIADAVDLETKRRRWGRFLGLRGCESPVREHGAGPEDTVVEDRRRMEELLEREWRREIHRRQEEERLQDKAEGWRYRW